MLGLALALLLSQTPPAVAPERGPLLEALGARWRCVRPGGTPEPLCDAVLWARHGTAAEVHGRNVLVGLTWRVRRDKGGRPSVGAPWLSALALHKDSLGLWIAMKDLAPEDAGGRRELAHFTREYEVFLRGRKASVELPCLLRLQLEVWSRGRVDRLVERKGGAWVPRGLPTELRKVGERWVAVGVPEDGDGLLLSVFVVRQDVTP